MTINEWMNKNMKCSFELEKWPWWKFPGLSIKKRRAVPWQIHLPQLISCCLCLDPINHDLSIHCNSAHSSCRNINIIIKDEMAFSIPTAKKPVSLYTVHDGAVHTVQRSPFYQDIILTIGGWNVAIWKEGVMVSCLRKAGVSVWSFVQRKTMETTDCSNITVPWGHI